MINFLNDMDELFKQFLLNMGVMAPLLSTLLIFFEGTLAFLPLFVFITVNVLTLGPVVGCIISWIVTTCGSYFCFYLARKGLSKKISKIIDRKEKVKRFMVGVSKLSFSQLVLIIAIPFMPSFFINLGAGISKISERKFLDALILGKVVITLFWAYIGTSLIESIKNPTILLKVVVLVLIAYIIGVLANKKFDLDGKY